MKRLAVLLFALGSICFAQTDFSEVEIKATHVADNVWMFEGAGGNIGVSSGEDGVLIVDDQFAPLADKIRAALAKVGPGKLEFVLNTHWHGDHVGGNEIFGREVSHRKDPGQRPACRCVESRDIGAYDTCSRGCLYCYATRSPARVEKNRQRHDPSATALLSP